MTERVYCAEAHEYGPPDPDLWSAWARQRTTEYVYQCPDCRLWVIWRPIANVTPEPEQLGLDTEETA